MDEKNYTGIIPGHSDGLVITSQSTAQLSDEESARILFEKAKTRLLLVNNWQELAGEFMAAFQITDENGTAISGPVQKGNYFKIDIPGPGTKAGEGYDWALVEEIEEYNSLNTESIGIRVRPAPNPITDNPDIAHFYSEESTSTFTVTREFTKVTAAVYDRNTKPNTDSGGMMDHVRNVLVGIAGMFSFSKIQWENFTNGLVKDL
ncbi:hypothetical protein [Dyadobacter sp. NIV53]|uniref:hypothetical protein n=1 Tax=Dyadobacter sp. NIV53 TaxID=2861765 RepID=UPI001C875CAE|nr:hypothetical protein [Dyadobacter sp. NIV53]